MVKLNKQVLGTVAVALMIGSSSVYANDIMSDGESFQMTEAQQKKLEDELKQSLKSVEKYQLNTDEMVLETPTIPDTQVPVEKTTATDFRNSITQSRETEVWQKNNFIEMRVALEKLAKTTVNQSGPYGMMYTTYGSDLFGGDWENNETKDITYTWGVGNKYMEKWMADNQVKKELASLASLSFKDIKGTEWYASHIPTAVYYGLIGGYPNGTFKGSAPVNRAELSIMLNSSNRQFITADRVPFNDRISSHKNQWYYNDMGSIMGGPMGLYGLTTNDMTAGMTRGEVAVILARRYFSVDFTKEWQNLKSSSFSDIKSITKSLEEMSHSEKKAEYTKQLKTPSSAPKEVVAALNLLKSKGIMIGDANGNSNWNKTVTRGEIVALFERCAQQYIGD